MSLFESEVLTFSASWHSSLAHLPADKTSQLISVKNIRIRIRIINFDILNIYIYN